MLEAAFAALRQILTPPFRTVLWKSLGLTLLLLALIWAGLDRLALSMVVVDHPLMHSILAFATGFGIIFSLGVNLVALMLLLVPGINVMAFFLANAYLFGREYFMLAAMRFRSSLEAEEIRRVNALTLFIGGLFIAIFVATPGLNLLTPLFATAFMVRL